MAFRLTKSHFIAGWQCHKLLWLKVHEPDAPELQMPKDSPPFDPSVAIKQAARDFIGGGVFIEPGETGHQGMAIRTKKAIRDGASVIHSGAFVGDSVAIVTDILKKRRGHWTFMEVGSATQTKDWHIPDAAIQTHVIRAAGLPVKRTEILLLNPECQYPDLSDLFLSQDLTGEVEPLLATIPGEIEAQIEMLTGDIPDAEPGDQCTNPFDCPFMERCCGPLLEHHISTLFNIRKARIAELQEDGIETIFDLPDGLSFNRIADRQIRSVKERAVIVEPGLIRELARFRPPLVFLDFETVNPAIPVWDDCHPYEHAPVQFSCVAQGRRGKPVATSWIADGLGDPRHDLAQALVRACSAPGSIVAYHASFERKCIEHLAEAVPGLTRPLLSFAERLIDLHPVIRNGVYHPAFHGSFSLKSVLPALVPEMSYEGLAISEGGTASLWLECLLLHSERVSKAKSAQVRADLVRYCETDTMAMARLLERLHAMAPG